MDKEGFKIYCDRLSNGKEEKLEETFSSKFLAIEEEDLIFEQPIKISGRAYVVDKELLLELHIKAIAKKPCAVCNQWGELEISLSPFMHAEPLSSIKGGIFDFSEILREEILLQVPSYWKCNKGKCPQEEGLKKYFGQSKKENFQENPFANINLSELK